MSKETRVITIFVSFLMLATFSAAIFAQGKSGVFPTGGADNPMLQGGGPAIGATATPTPIPLLVAPYDFNHDLKPDFVLLNASTRQTAVWYMNNNIFAGSVLAPPLPAGWSIAGIADFNRDGKADYLLFNASTRQSAIWYLSGVTRIGAVYGPTIASGYQLMGAADFNGDVKPDYVLFNPSTRGTALWYLNNNIFIGSAY